MIAEVIAETTPVTIGVVLGVIAGLAAIAGFVGGVWKVVSAFSALGARIDTSHEKTNHRLDMLEQSLGLRMEALEKRPHGFVSKSVLRAWISAMRAANDGKGIVWVRLDDVDKET